MLKNLNLLICLSVLMLSDGKIMNFSEKPGRCPLIPVTCNLFRPIRHEHTFNCIHDLHCKSTYKCCKTTCYSYKICIQPNPNTIINDNALETTVKESPLNHIDDNIKKIFKQGQDNITSDNELKQLSNTQENDIQGQKENKTASDIKFVFFNIIQNIYIQNLNIYKGADKRVDAGNTENINTNTENQGCIDDEDCLITKESGSGLEPKEPKPSSTITSAGSEHVTVTLNPSTNPTIHSDNQRCQDDEDCHSTEGSGFIFEGSGTGFSSEESDSDEFETSGNKELQIDNLVEEFGQIALPNIPTEPTKYKTADGTYYLLFEKEVELINDTSVTYEIEKEIEF